MSNLYSCVDGPVVAFKCRSILYCQSVEDSCRTVESSSKLIFLSMERHARSITGFSSILMLSRCRLTVESFLKINISSLLYETSVVELGIESASSNKSSFVSKKKRTEYIVRSGYNYLLHALYIQTNYQS